MLSMCTRCNIRVQLLGNTFTQCSCRSISSISRHCLLAAHVCSHNLGRTPINLCIGSLIAAIAPFHKLSEAQRHCSAPRSAHTTAFAWCGMSQRNPGCGTAASLLSISNTVSCLCERALR